MEGGEGRRERQKKEENIHLCTWWFQSFDAARLLVVSKCCLIIDVLHVGICEPRGVTAASASSLTVLREHLWVSPAFEFDP